MAKNYFSLLLLIVAAALTKVHAQDAPVLTFDLPAQNNIRFNRFLMNPTFSYVRENNRYVSVYHRSQWIQFDDSPKVYMLGYTGRFAENAGFGIGVYQQNIGVITSFGGVGNYAYNIRLFEDMNLTLGVNVAYYSSGVNKSRTVTESPDPVLQAMRNNSLASIKPGINLSYRGFDFGVYAENFIEYDFKSNKMVEDYSDKTYSGHLMYTGHMNNMPGILQDGMFRVSLGGQMDDSGFGFNGGLLVDFPRIGWLQTSVHDYYGVGVGAGFHLTKRLSLGYVYERTMKEGLVNLGPTHELTMIFNINDAPFEDKQEEIKISEKNPLEGDLQDVEFEETEDVAAKEPEFDKDAELEKLKMELDDESLPLLEILIKEDSLATVQKADFEKKVKNLMEYAQREYQAKQGEQLRFNPETGAVEIERKADSLASKKVEKEIKEFYSSKTSKPRKSLKKVNKLTIEGLDAGYYIIANVFSTQENADKFIKKLRSKGFRDAGYFVNPKNNFRYVYLKMHTSWREAMIAYYSNMNNTYFDTIWIGSINFK